MTINWTRLTAAQSKRYVARKNCRCAEQKDATISSLEKLRAETHVNLPRAKLFFFRKRNVLHLILNHPFARIFLSCCFMLVYSPLRVYYVIFASPVRRMHSLFPSFFFCLLLITLHRIHTIANSARIKPCHSRGTFIK